MLDVFAIAIYIICMIFTKEQMNYLSELPSVVAHALPKAANANVPFFLNDPVVQNYELLRVVWFQGQSVTQACSATGRLRRDYYKLENAFLHHGVSAVYPEMGAARQNEKLERLALLVKSTRPKATEKMILRLSEALGLDPCPSLRTIGRVLHCHGIGNVRDKSERQYWHGIQQSVQTIERLKNPSGPARDTKNRRETFYQAEEGLQIRFELFRELAMGGKETMAEVIRRYGLSRPTFYKYLDRFRHYGLWGVVDWQQAGRGRLILSQELELNLIEEKLQHPSLSINEIIANLKLKCSRTAIYELLKYWSLIDKSRPPVRLHGFWDAAEEAPAPLLRTAKAAAEAGQFRVHAKLNGHFADLLQRLKSRAMNICDPGPIILAQFVDDLGICESLQLYGPSRGKGSEMTNLVLLNVFRILAGYESVSQLSSNSDRSVAVGAGVGMFPGKTVLYESYSDLKSEHLQHLRNDGAARARDLGLIRGERIGQDFHFKEFYGQDPEAEEIGKGPNSAGEICPGFRPHLLWDLDTDVLINIAFCNGASRATTTVRNFCEKNLYPILEREAIREIYMDSEYTSFPVINYFIVDEFSNTDVTMCLKRNRRIEQLMREVMDNAQWEEFDKDSEITGKVLELDNLTKPLHLVVKRDKKTGDLRCFGTTVKGLDNREVLQRYRLRWPIENGLKDLIHSYFIDHIMGKDPETIETNFYCIQMARLAYENFLISLDERFVRDSSGYKKTLSTFRYLLFGKHNCELRLRRKHLELTFLDGGHSPLHTALQELLARRSERGLNRVTWWGGLGLTLKFEDQFV